MAKPVERFAPSPTGLLHLGHAFSALTAFEAAKKDGGRFLIRIEDIDTTRSRSEYEDAIFEDLAWLGLDWEEPVLRQTERFDAYRAALDDLKARKLIYPCFCTRKEINALSAPHHDGSAMGPDGPAYPGTCRALPEDSKRMQRDPFAWRLDIRKAIASIGGAGIVKKLSFKEVGKGPNGERKKINLDPGYLIDSCGDVVLGRKETPASYHLSVVLDDALQQITHVTRGQDLFAATSIHRLLQAMFGRPTPSYRHHRLITDESGKRLAKRDDARSLRSLREGGATPEDVRKILGMRA
jgi:glutamyl-Q tRNA(Asp) synthetase